MGDQHVLVTGAMGLIGNAVRTLLENRGTPVVAIDRIGGDVNGRPVLDCDVTDIHGLHALARRVELGGIVHCGAYSGPMVAVDHPVQMIQVNTLGATNIAELARVAGGVRVVFASTATAYGDIEGTLIGEDTVMRPTSMYGASKAAAELVLDAYRRQFGVDTVSLRVCWVYGPRRTTACLIREMLMNTLANRETVLPFDPGFARQYMHVDDVARAMVAALDTAGLPRQAYNITGGTRLTLQEVAETVTRAVPGAQVRFAPGDDAEDDDPQGLFDISAAQRDFGFSPAISLNAGVASYFNWIKLQGAVS